MKVFSTSDYYGRFTSPFCEGVKECAPGKGVVDRFANGEMHVELGEDVKNQDCLIIGSTTSDDQLLALLMLADALKRGGARTIRLVAPYLGYTRQDNIMPGKSGGIAFIGTLLRSVGINGVVTIDIHNETIKQLLGIPIISLPPAKLFAPTMQMLAWNDATFVAPDEGAVNRTQAVALSADSSRPVSYMVKKRADGIVQVKLMGEVGARVVLVDDIIDSGKTLLSACEELRKKGVKDIAIFVTHGLFTGDTWGKLFTLGVRMLFVSDSCPEAMRQSSPAVHIISSVPLLRDAIPTLIGREGTIR